MSISFGKLNTEPSTELTVVWKVMGCIPVKYQKHIIPEAGHRDLGMLRCQG